MKKSVFKGKFELLIDEELESAFEAQTDEEKLQFVRKALGDGVDAKYPNDPIDVIVEAE